MKKTINTALLYRRIFLLIYDIAAVFASSVMALWMRYEFVYKDIDPVFLDSVYSFMPITMLITVVVFEILRLYNSLWAFASVNELQNIVAACGVTAALNGLGLMIAGKPVPRSYYFMFVFLQIAFTFASRFSYRFLRSLRQKGRKKERMTNIMIIGAGEAANLIIKDIINSRYTHMQIKCLIDDDVNKHGKFIQGIKIIGGRDKIKEAVDTYAIDEIFIAMPSVSRSEISKIIEICKDTTCKLRTLPGMYQLVNGEVNVSKLKDVDVEDLLGRDPIVVDIDSILGYVQGRCVLVTGGGGSIGSELCRQVMRFKPGKLLIFDIYENCAYELLMELQQKYGRDIPVTVLVGSIRDKKRLDEVFETYHPTVVFHAAAHKHVPLMEVSPAEAVKNNVLGTKNLLVSASEHDVERFVQLSTDKAVNPTSVMGCTKRICEMLIQTFAGNTDMKCVAVRFGNVLGSHGSVIPLFEAQIKKGGPVTLTDPNIERYFMTIPEAAQLVLQAGALAESGNIYVLDMGEPVKIMDLAKQLIRFYGYEPGVNMEIKIVGLRPGEKLYEELMMDEEQDKMRRTQHNKIFVASPRSIDLAEFYEQLQELAEAAQHNDEGVVQQLAKMIPTFTPTRQNLKL